MMPQVANPSMRACQIEAITNVEESLADGKRRSLIQMQTSSGKTYTAVSQSSAIGLSQCTVKCLFEPIFVRLISLQSTRFQRD
jgi:type I site-specific restriction endonuclease